MSKVMKRNAFEIENISLHEAMRIKGGESKLVAIAEFSVSGADIRFEFCKEDAEAFIEGLQLWLDQAEGKEIPEKSEEFLQMMDDFKELTENDETNPKMTKH
ncbi:hypothetical protein KAR91_23080 [Candidatus Pacearchaeota archaeon]|nr:hypothetical protein [Candidatus Pacearchaeota archaeon]